MLIRKRILLAALCVVLGVTSATPAFAGNDGNSGRGGHGGSPVVSPQSRVFGADYGQWGARWWQWLFQTPVAINPVLGADPGTPENPAEVDCSAGQRGPVWFLGGTFQNSDAPPPPVVFDAYRSCTIPSETYLFFPIINQEADNLSCPPPNTFGPYSGKDLVAAAQITIDKIDRLDARIDGYDVRGLSGPSTRYRALSPWFSYRMPEDNVGPLYCGESFLFPRGTMPPRVDHHAGAIVAGVYLMLAPLSPGVHQLHFGGHTKVPDDIDLPTAGLDFVQNINYTITVASRCSHGYSAQSTDSGCGH